MKREPTFKYEIVFHKPLSNNLKHIYCQSSITGNFLYVIWDAVEDCLRMSTSYQTMFDIYGHFTEPHPIFDLKAELIDDSDNYLRFAHYFANTANNNRIFHSEVLNRIAGFKIENEKEFINLIKNLRNLRFDVRVNQTNSKIPRDHFRCCYPFTLSLNRQISVTWNEFHDSEEISVN